MTTPAEIDLLVEETATAWRPTRAGGVGSHAAWHDLDAGDRERAFEVTRTQRALEAALDPDGLSGTAHAVLARIRGGSDAGDVDER
jgi:hypothetical protein